MMDGVVLEGFDCRFKVAHSQHFNGVSRWWPGVKGGMVGWPTLCAGSAGKILHGACDRCRFYPWRSVQLLGTLWLCVKRRLRGDVQ